MTTSVKTMGYFFVLLCIHQQSRRSQDCLISIPGSHYLDLDFGPSILYSLRDVGVDCMQKFMFFVY